MEINIQNCLKIFRCRYLKSEDVINISDKKKVTELGINIAHFKINPDAIIYEYKVNMQQGSPIIVTKIYEIQSQSKTQVIIVSEKGDIERPEIYNIYNCYISPSLANEAHGYFITRYTSILDILDDNQDDFEESVELFDQWFNCTILFDFKNNKLIIASLILDDLDYYFIFFIKCLLRFDTANQELYKKLKHKANLYLGRSSLLSSLKKIFKKQPNSYELATELIQGVQEYIEILGKNDNIIKEKYLKYKRKYLELRNSIN